MTSATRFLALAILVALPFATSAQSTGVAHIKLSGNLDESPTDDGSFFGPAKENMSAKLARIAKAKSDPKIKALYLEIGDLDIGWGKLAEVRRAIAEFRDSGKKTYAYAEDLDATAYLVASGCEVVGMPECGTLMVIGLQAQVSLYKDLLEKVKLKADAVKMGAYKGAIEPFTRSELSKENREQIESLLDDHFANDLVATIAASRPTKKWSAEQVKKLIDEGPFTARKSAEMGLIDRVLYPTEFEGAIEADLQTDKFQIARNYGKAKNEDLDLSNPLSALMKVFAGSSKPKATREPKIAVIYAVGAIVSGKSANDPFTGGIVGSDTIVEAVRQAEKDPSVKAIVLRVDSPGGSALASDLMWKELISCKKPVIASMGDVAASGGYYISMAARKIYAEPGTTTGSIGVFGMKIVTGDLMNWAGVKTETFVRGKNAGLMTMNRPFNDDERKAMEVLIEATYDQFIAKALAGREKAGVKMSREKLLSLAGGRVWTGRQAKAAGLVDELGTLGDAIASAKSMAGLDPKREMELLVLPKPTSFLEQFVDGDAKLPLPFGSAEVRLLSEIPESAEALKAVGGLLRTRTDPIKVLMPYHIRVK